jgi:hypothetical protein
MGIMIIPYVSSLSEDAMRAVPMSLREGSYAMGATRLQTALKVVVPAATSGIASAYILGISRAVGETMILAVAAGMQPNLTFNPLEPAATITSYIVQVAWVICRMEASGTRRSSRRPDPDAPDPDVQSDRPLDAAPVPGGVLMQPVRNQHGLRQLIRKHKRWDLLFGLLGLFALRSVS